jgi:ABC-type transporter Mla MlaB component
MPRRVVLSGEFGIAELDALCVQLVPLTSLTEPEPVTIDLSGLRGVSASALAVLVSALRTAYADGLCDPLAALSPPREPERHGLPDRAALKLLIERPGEGQAGGLREALDGCEPFSNVDGIMRAREALLASICQQARLAEQARSAVRQLIWDLGQNVLAHAEVGAGVAAARINSCNRTLELAVADCGIGIRESFARSEVRDVDDDASAVIAALQPGVTSDPGRGKGMGLFFAKVVLANNEGTLTVRSGSARVDTPTHMQMAGPLPNFKGTLVTALARLDKPLDFDVVDRELQRPQGVAS